MSKVHTAKVVIKAHSAPDFGIGKGVLCLKTFDFSEAPSEAMMAGSMVHLEQEMIADNVEVQWTEGDWDGKRSAEFALKNKVTEAAVEYVTVRREKLNEKKKRDALVLEAHPESGHRFSALSEYEPPCQFANPSGWHSDHLCEGCQKARGHHRSYMALAAQQGSILKKLERRVNKVKETV